MIGRSSSPTFTVEELEIELEVEVLTVEELEIELEVEVLKLLILFTKKYSILVTTQF